MRTGGFTLVEVLIVITIMTIITAIVLTALPLARNDQAFESDIIQLRSTLSRAQQQALNEIRSPECLDIAGGDSELERRCSDVGVAILEKRVVMFADLTGDMEYSSGADFQLEELVAVTSPESGAPVSVMFTASPPNVTTFVDGVIIGAGQTASLTLTLDEISRDLLINPYGILEDATTG